MRRRNMAPQLIEHATPIVNHRRDLTGYQIAADAAYSSDSDDGGPPPTETTAASRPRATTLNALYWVFGDRGPLEVGEFFWTFISIR
jgi:hypothetical protein